MSENGKHVLSSLHDSLALLPPASRHHRSVVVKQQHDLAHTLKCNGQIGGGPHEGKHCSTVFESDDDARKNKSDKNRDCKGDTPHHAALLAHGHDASKFTVACRIA